MNKPTSNTGPKNTPRSFVHIGWTMVVAIISAVLLIALIIAWAWVFNTPAPDVSGGEEMVTIEQGISLRQIAQLLASKHLTNDELAFRIAARISNVDKKILPGTYLLPHAQTNARLLKLLRRPMDRTRNITIPEGLNIRDVAGILQHDLGTDSAAFVRTCLDSVLCYQLAVPAHSLEGYLFPNTYNFYVNTPPRTIAERMVDHFFSRLGDSLKTRIHNSGLSLHEVITLASLIEGEVQVQSEATLVSAVYRNRLRKGMALEADPTIQYIIPDGPRRLRHSDLQIDNPYNTYRHTGLPPGPICNPGMRSIIAALNPANVGYLYFVAQGDGSHAFSQNYADHLTAKKKLDQIRRDLDRERQAQG